MMYRHVVEECIKRAEKELRTYRMYHNTEAINHVQKRIDSLYRIKQVAPAATIGKDSWL